MAQVKINDLSVGDWVEWMGERCKVDLPLLNTVFPHAKIYPAYTSATLQPIPITPEILGKNGFEVYDDTARLKLDRPYALWLFKVQEGWDLHLPSREQHINLRIEHIHQLQHALRLAGVEKEIEL